MNHRQAIERIITNAERPGYFRRDHEGNEHEVQGYVVQFSYEAKIRGEENTVTTFETAVVVAPSLQAAKAAATRPYDGANILSAGAHHLGNPTIIRFPSI